MIENVFDAESSSDDDGQCDDHEITFEHAMDVRIPTPQVLTLLKENIIIQDDIDDTAMAGGAGVVKHEFGKDFEDQFKIEKAFLIQRMYDVLMKLDAPVLHMADETPLLMDRDTNAVKPSSTFMFAICLILAMHASGKCLIVSMKGRRLGIPGTTLTLRRALRCLLEDSKYCSVNSLLKEMSEVGNALIHI